MAPFKSRKQEAWMEDQVRKGKISKETFLEWKKDTPPNIPERVEKKDKKLNEYKKVKIGKVKVI